MKRKQNFQSWRVVAEQENGTKHLIILGYTYEQVKKEYIDSFCDLLTQEEQFLIRNIKIEKWKGAEDCGKWVYQEQIGLPHLTFV